MGCRITILAHGAARTGRVRSIAGKLDAGERTAIELASSIGADAALMNDRAGVSAALAKGIAVLGTIGVLDRAAHRGLCDLEVAFARLRATNFRYPPALLDTLLSEGRDRHE